MNLIDSSSNDSDLVSAILTDKETAFEFQKRKHSNWDENYLLYRDRVITNRLTQRQSVNVPIMAETISTWLSKVDEPPMITFQALDGKDIAEKTKAMYWDAIWLDYFEKWKLDEVDAMDKKVVALQGRSFKKLYWSNNDLNCKVIDPFDVDIDPKTNPLNIETAMYIIFKNIFVPVREIIANPKYLPEGVTSLKQYLSTGQGKIVMASSEEERQHQQQRLSTMGVTNFDEFGASDTIVEINEVFKKIWHDDEKAYKLHYIVMACNNSILYDKPVMEAIGVDFYPLTSWSEDPDLNDLWNDSKADRIRPTNKVMNTWLSQMIENRTLRNFSMFFYDSSNPKYRPTSFDPQPMGMYPLPGKPADVLAPIPVQPLTDTLNELNYFKKMAEEVSGITSTEKGQAKDDGNRTLGEIQIDLRESTQRIVTTSKYYRNSWEEFATKWQKMLEANRTDNYELYKQGANGDLQKKVISPAKTQSKTGFKVRAKIKADVDNKNNDEMKKVIFVLNLFKDNPVAQQIGKEQVLALVNWSPEDIQNVMKAEEQKLSTPVAPVNGGGGVPVATDTGGIPSGMNPEMFAKVHDLITKGGGKSPMTEQK